MPQIKKNKHIWKKNVGDGESQIRSLSLFLAKKCEKKVFQKKLKVAGKQIVAGRKSRDNRKT